RHASWSEHQHHDHCQHRRRSPRAAERVPLPVSYLRGDDMAKLSLINRDVKRAKLVEKFANKRNALKTTINDTSTSDEERYEPHLQLQQLRRNANPTRLRNRCAVTGRPRGVYRKFGVGRVKLREMAMRGEVPGMTKASW